MSHVGVWTGVVRGKVVHATVNNAPCWRFAMPIGGDRAGDTQWVNFTLWDERNRAVAEAIVAGSNLTVAGWAKPGVWKDAKGEPQPALYVRCLSVTFLKGMGRPSDTVNVVTRLASLSNNSYGGCLPGCTVDQGCACGTVFSSFFIFFWSPLCLG